VKVRGLALLLYLCIANVPFHHHYCAHSAVILSVAVDHVEPELKCRKRDCSLHRDMYRLFTGGHH
jgi:hypothetical protein